MIAERILNRLVDRLAVALAPPSVPLRSWLVDGALVGAIDDARAESLARFTEVFRVDASCVRFVAHMATSEARTAALERVARALSAEGALTRWRDELYVVAAPRPFLIERAAARYFGIATKAAHVNGTTASPEGMWIARRSPAKSIDPGQLDNLVGGGIAAGAGSTETVIKEAWEEAGIPASLARTALPAGFVRIWRTQPDGLQHETIHVHDLVLPDGFEPSNRDGEVTDFRLVSPEDAAMLAGNVAGDDIVTADASLVIADWLLRHGYVATDSEARMRLGRLRRGAPP